MQNPANTGLQVPLLSPISLQDSWLHEHGQNFSEIFGRIPSRKAHWLGKAIGRMRRLSTFKMVQETRTFVGLLIRVYFINFLNREVPIKLIHS
jgi:hypothetical protein